MSKVTLDYEEKKKLKDWGSLNSSLKIFLMVNESKNCYSIINLSHHDWGWV